MMLLTATTAWAVKLHVNITFPHIQLNANEATVNMTYGSSTVSVYNGYELDGYDSGRNFSFTVTAQKDGYDISKEFSATANGQPIAITQNGDTYSFTADETYDTTVDITIECTKTFYVFFKENGGKGTMDPQAFIMAEKANLTANKFTRKGYSFTHWNTKPDGSGTTYADQQEISLARNITLYAQ